MSSTTARPGWRAKIHEVIYGTHTPAGKLFDVVLLIAIVFSIIIVMLESVQSFDSKYHDFLIFPNGSLPFYLQSSTYFVSFVLPNLNAIF